MTISYTTGTVSVTAGSDIVTGSGTAWVIANISPGSFGLDSANGNPIPVAEITSNTSLRLVTPWRGTSVSGSAYWISYDTRDGQQTVNNAQRLAEYIARLDNDALKAIAALTPGDELVPVFSGPDSAVLVPRADFGSGGSGGGVDVNAQVSTLADRAQYNSEIAGFRVLVSNVGDGRAAVYTKNSISIGDWSDPAYFTGPSGAPGNDGNPGDPGPYTTIVVGDVTTLPPGSQATVDFRQVGIDTVALDIGLPAGQDGTGTGDVVGPASAGTGKVAVFSDGTGKVISASPVTIADVAPFRSKLINATGRINQLGVSGTVSLAAGSYGHDMFKAGVGGCTYTFYVANGVTTFNITSGTLMTVIEANRFSGDEGLYLLGWVGTAQARINSGSYGVSGSVSATLDGSQHVSVEWSVGTMSKPQLEKLYLSSFKAQSPEADEIAAYRYMYRWTAAAAAERFTLLNAANPTRAEFLLTPPFPLRANPNFSYGGTWTAVIGSSIYPFSAIGVVSLRPHASALYADSTGMPAESPGQLRAGTAGAWLMLDARL